MNAHREAYKVELKRDNKPPTFRDVELRLAQVARRYGPDVAAGLLADHGANSVERLDESSYTSIYRAARALVNAPK